MHENNNNDRELEQVQEDEDLNLLILKKIIKSDPDGMYGYEEVYWLANQTSMTRQRLRQHSLPPQTER